jgi:P27 family predicted phage terminase small subunit
MAGKKGKSGRKPKPTNILKLQGTWRRDRHKAKKINLPVSLPEPPKILQGTSLDEWHRITKLLAITGSVTELDMSALVGYCVEYAKFTNANEKLAKTDSMLVRSTKGTVMANPLLKISDHALANMLRIAQDFGFSPAARRSLRIEPKAEELNEKSRFFGKNA